MKKLILFLTSLSLVVSTPALANSNRHDPRWGVDRNQHSPYYNRQHDNRRNDRHRDERHRNDRRGVSTGEAVAIGVGALILGGIIGSKNRNTHNEQVVQPVRRQPTYVCQDVIEYDYYGNAYVAGRNCWYQ